MRRAAALALGAWTVASLLWLGAGLAGDNPKGLSIALQTLRAAGFLLATVGLWSLYWVRRTPLAIGLIAVGVGDVTHFCVSLGPESSALGLMVESVEAVGATVLAVLGGLLLARRPIELHWMIPGIGLMAATALFWTLATLGSPRSLPYLPGNLVAIAGSALFIAFAARRPELLYSDLEDPTESMGSSVARAN